MGLLEEICRQRRSEIRALRSRISLADLEASPAWPAARRPLASALKRGDGQAIHFLAEIKRASPSAGAIRPGADPAEIGRSYEEAGAAAISILTESAHFDGDPSFLALVREVAGLPLLMKDFLVDDWQVPWARSLGADAVLVIVAALDSVLLGDLLVAAREVGLEALVEVHNEAELDRALEAGARIVGVNHRNLQSLAIDLTLSERLLPRMPGEIVRVAESGIGSREDVVRLERAGFDALLVGETLMRAASPGAALRRLRGVEGEGS